jgi:hypothetical protein
MLVAVLTVDSGGGDVDGVFNRRDFASKAHTHTLYVNTTTTTPRHHHHDYDIQQSQPPQDLCAVGTSGGERALPPP